MECGQLQLQVTRGTTYQLTLSSYNFLKCLQTIKNSIAAVVYVPNALHSVILMISTDAQCTSRWGLWLTWPLHSLILRWKENSLYVAVWPFTTDFLVRRRVVGVCADSGGTYVKAFSCSKFKFSVLNIPALFLFLWFYLWGELLKLGAIFKLKRDVKCMFF